MKIKETPGRIVFKVINTIILAALAFVCLVPLWHVLMASISDPTYVTQHSGVIMWPLHSEGHPVTLKGYTVVLKNASLIRGYANTIFYVVAGCILCIIFSSLAAYCMSRRRTMWMKYLTIMLTFTMFFNGGLIPTYMVNKFLGIVNTRWVIIVMGLISIFNIIIIKTAFQSLPASLEESAQLDGAGHITILFKIVLPLTKATIAVIALFYAVGKWNEYLTAAIYLTNRNLYPLQIILREILIENSGSSDIDLSSLGSYDLYKKLIQYSTIIFATAPILCIYPFVQKYFVKGVMIGSIKG
ncbi:MAG: carbohydrate ABC transporter permease [Oscillospiraceae bacterium]|nr:carbohydrate ABC transporter permease [Oscillospiraceae bacterium]